MLTAGFAYGRRAAIVAVFLLVLTAAGAGLQSGGATPSTKYYSSGLSPATGYAGQHGGSYTLTLTNSTTSTQTLGAENVTLPSGWSWAKTGVTAPSGKSWTATADSTGRIIQLRAASNGDALNPGQSVQVSLTLSIPCSATSTALATEAKQSNSFSGPPGNDFLPLSGSNSIAFTVTGGCHIAFDSISSPQTAGHGVAYTVREFDGNNNPTRFAATGTLTTNFTATGPLDQASTTSANLAFDANGVAVGSATDYTAENSRHLSASAGGSSVDSGSFDVQPDVADHLAFGTQPTGTIRLSPIATFTVDVYDQWGNLETRADQQQQVALSIGNDAGDTPPTTLGGTTTEGSTGGVASFSDITLNESGVGFTLDADATGLDGATSAPFDIFDGCPAGIKTCTLTNKQGNTQVTLDYPTLTGLVTELGMSDPNTAFSCNQDGSGSRGSLITIDPSDDDQGAAVYTWQNPITVTLRFDKSIVPGTGVTNFVVCVSKGGAYSVVQDCPKKLTAKTVLPCASHRNRNNAGDLVITLLMGSNDPVIGLH